MHPDFASIIFSVIKFGSLYCRILFESCKNKNNCSLISIFIILLIINKTKYILLNKNLIIIFELIKFELIKNINFN